MSESVPPIQVEWLGSEPGVGAGTGTGTGRLRGVDYGATLAAMRQHAADRLPGDADRIWLCMHPPVYTQGLAGRPAHVHAPGDIPLVATDRGGQVTYHGPGQVVAYPLVDLRRLRIGVKEYVHRLEHCVLRTLQAHGVTGHRVRGAPGVYVLCDAPTSHGALTRSYADDGMAAFDGLAKIAALGVRVGRQCSYHGLALNVAMDLSPFARIDPCGYPGLPTVDLATLGVQVGADAVAGELAACLRSHLSP